MDKSKSSQPYFHKKEDKLGDTLTSIGSLFLLGGVGTVLYQIYLWLREGEWLRLSLIDATKLMYGDPYYSSDPFLIWLYYPQDWAGIQKILDHIPLSLSLTAIGILFITIALNRE